MKTENNYLKYRKEVSKKLVENLKELSKFMDVDEIPLDYCPEKPYELLSYLEDLIEAFKKQEENIK